MKWKSDARIWGLIGFGVGAVLASGGSLTSPFDSLLGGLIQGAIWFFVSRYFIRRGVRKSEDNAFTRPKGSKSKTLFLFDRPITSDWLFYVFAVILTVNVINGFSNVMESGGFTLDSYGGLASGLTDAVFRVLLAWFPLIPILFLIRKLIRKFTRKEETPEN